MKKALKQFAIFVAMGIAINMIVKSSFSKRGLDNLNQPKQENIQEENLLRDTTFKDEEGRDIVKNSDDILVLVNKERYLPSDYEPEDLIIPEVAFSFDEDLEKRYLRKEAAENLSLLFQEAKEDDLELFAVSGYRSFNTQESVFNNKINQSSLEEAEKLVAKPGQSEHQTGLAVDVSSREMNLLLEEEFGDTKEGIWLQENSHDYGFIIRYPKDKVHITMYDYEPWHLRYVGEEAAKKIYENSLTLEEYLGFKQ